MSILTFLIIPTVSIAARDIRFDFVLFVHVFLHLPCCRARRLRSQMRAWDSTLPPAQASIHRTAQAQGNLLPRPSYQPHHARLAYARAIATLADSEEVVIRFAICPEPMPKPRCVVCP